MDLDSIKVTYFAECTEQLAELESGLFGLANDGPDEEVINSVFRAVHSIKGGAGAFAFDEIVSFAHVFENALDVLRNDLSQSTPERLEMLLQSSDVLSDIVNATANGAETASYEELSMLLEKEFELVAEDPEEEVEFEAVPISLDDFDLPQASPQTSFDIRFKPLADLYLCGHEPQRIFRELSQLGEITVQCDADNVPGLNEYKDGSSNLVWNIQVQTEKSIAEVESIFEWVSHLCELEVTAHSEDAEYAEIDINDFLNNASGDLSDNEEHESSLDNEEPNAQSLNLVEVVDPVSSLLAVETAQSEQSNEQHTKLNAKLNSKDSGSSVAPQQGSKTIRADSEKVDRLINLMGELVISQSMLSVQISEGGIQSGSPTALALVALQNLTREIQSSVMSIRAQPIKPVFMRMSRVIREVCSSTGKKAQLQLEGEQTEVDTTVTEGLSDPLTHMIRNSVDHGIESPERRAELGKPEQGVITLSAFHSSGNIVIQISDDGAGINREKVVEKAMERGIIGPDSKLSDNDIDNLIFAPGFSTADAITDVSGRGVGMDVVRQSIQQLGGRVSISSEPDKGSQFTLVLPLTLAILDGMLVREANQMFVVPVGSVVETLSLRSDDIFEVGTGQKVLKLRDQLLPLVDVGFELGFSNRRPDFENCTVLVVESGKNSASAFVVSSIEGQQQVVIKSIESNYHRIPSISAATILGNGRIALILDVEEIINRKNRQSPPPQILDKAG